MEGENESEEENMNEDENACESTHPLDLRYLANNVKMIADQPGRRVLESKCYIYQKDKDSYQGHFCCTPCTKRSVPNCLYDKLFL